MGPIGPPSAAILLLMQIDPAEEWQRLSEHYRGMFDEELEELARSFGDLTETAQQVLRNELKNRGMAAPGTKPKAGSGPDCGPSAPEGVRWASAVDPDAGAGSDGESDSPDGSAGSDGPIEFSWKTVLCECDAEEQALAICQALRRAGIENWYQAPGRGWSTGGPRVMVAADQLEQARQIASQPIPQEILDDLRLGAPEYEAPPCPACHAVDPVLESAEPSNNWLCEACGHQWSDPWGGEDREVAQGGRQGA
jgi:hypothetical protein